MVALLCHLPLRRNCRAKRRSPLGGTVGASAQLTLRPSNVLINLFFCNNDNDLISTPPITARTAEDRLYLQNLQARNQSARSARSNTSEHCPKASRTEFAPTSQGCAPLVEHSASRPLVEFLLPCRPGLKGSSPAVGSDPKSEPVSMT